MIPHDELSRSRRGRNSNGVFFTIYSEFSRGTSVHRGGFTVPITSKTCISSHYSIVFSSIKYRAVCSIGSNRYNSIQLDLDSFPCDSTHLTGKDTRRIFDILPCREWLCEVRRSEWSAISEVHFPIPARIVRHRYDMMIHTPTDARAEILPVDLRGTVTDFRN